MRKSDLYWKARNLISELAILDGSILHLETLLAKQYRLTSKRIIKRMRSLYTEISADKKGEVLVSHLYEYNRYYEMMNLIDSELADLGIKEQSLLSRSMTSLYMNNKKLLNVTFGLNSDISKELALKVLSDYWVADGKLWSDRIWTNKAKLKEALEQGMFDTITTGGGVDRLTTTLMEKCSTSFSNALRLARTELLHVYNTSSLDTYKEEGLTKVQICTAKESVTNWNMGLNSNGTDPNNRKYTKMNSKYRKAKGEVCLLCLDNEERDIGFGRGTYLLQDAPVLPTHCNCRCCYIPVVNIENNESQETKE